MNWVDAVIIVIFIFYAVEGMAVGLIKGFLDLASFILSFILALKFYSIGGTFLAKSFSFPPGFANAFGFFLAAFLLETIISIFVNIFVKKIPRVFFNNLLDRTFGFLPGLLSAGVLLSFFLTLILTLPLSAPLKSAVNDSKIAGFLVSQTAGLERFVNQIFGQAISETINFITIKPGEREIVDLKFKTSNLKTDTISEKTMFDLVNKERRDRGLSILAVDNKLTQTARKHGTDMFQRGYFSHYTPEGLSPADRLAQNNIDYGIAAENLAFAPNVALAHDGLMKSEGHRKNILTPEFTKIGIGVIDGGIYGKMFVQEFTD